MSASVEPFNLSIDQSELDDLREKLARTRWPDAETVSDWRQGVPLASVRALCDYWQNGYDWRRCEAMLNGWGQFVTEIDGNRIHFLHIRSPEPDALPMIMTHGWPGSVIEFHKVIGPLTDPVAHGGRAEDAFHLVIPSLPGYGFSEKPQSTGWGVERIGAAWIELMERLGYDRYVAQGGDWGYMVTTTIAKLAPPACLAVHLNVAIAPPTEDDLTDLTAAEEKALADFQRFSSEASAYGEIQRTRPQTLGYALTDSPVGQAAWIYEKYFEWTDNSGSPEDILSYDEMLDNIMLYWLPANAASSARLYWESLASSFQPCEYDFPIGLSIFPGEIFRPSRRWADHYFKNLIYWNEPQAGGHFAAFEQPAIFVEELRQCFRQVRSGRSSLG